MKNEEEESYHKSERVSNFWITNYFEYKNNRDKSKTLSLKEHIDKIKPYLKDIINNLKKSNMWKIPLIIASNFIFSTDNDKVHLTK